MPDSSGSGSGSEGTRISLRTRRLAILWSVSTQAECHKFLKNWFVVSTKFLVDDDFVVGATENDAAASLIADVSLVQQVRRPFASMGNKLATR